MQRDNNNGHTLTIVMKALMFIGLVVCVSSFNQKTVKVE